MPKLDLSTGALTETLFGATSPGSHLEAGVGDDALRLAVEAAGRDGEIFIRFAKFNDGRGFSLARLLRERHGFTGVLVATGHVIPDQAAFLRRSGFDKVELPNLDHLAHWQQALTAFSGTYQTAYRDQKNQRRWAATTPAAA